MYYPFIYLFLECGENEYYATTSYDIPKTCDNWVNYDYLIKTTKEEPSCQCKSTYVLDEINRKCVSPNNCTKEPTCPEYEIFAQNGDTTDCFQYSRNESDHSESPGCFCKTDYIRDIMDFPRKCIQKSVCSCGEHQYIDYGKTGKTCDNRHTSQFDTSVQLERCHCDFGYFLENANSSKCLLDADCPNPPKCLSVNQTFKLSAPDSYCPRKPYGSYNDFRVTAKEEDCYCKDGYVKSWENYNCILQEECPMLDCIGNLTYRISSRDKSCSDIGNECSIDESNSTWLDCFCKEGYVRHPNGIDCILPQDCITCQENQELINRGCQDTCDTWSADQCSVIGNGYVCSCKKGYVFENATSDKCILIENCPTRMYCLYFL